MQPSHLGSIIPFVWSSKQLANSMNYYNPIRHLGCHSTGRPVCLCVCPVCDLHLPFKLPWKMKWSHAPGHTQTHTCTLSLLPYRSMCIFYLQIMFCLFPLCYRAATNGKNGISFLSPGFFSSSFFQLDSCVRLCVCLCGSCGWHSGRQMAISLSL